MENKKFLKKVASLFFLMSLHSGFSKADVPNLSNLSLDNVDDTFKTFGALLNFRPMEPASSFGKYFGVSLGLEAHGTSSKKLGFISNVGSFPKYLPDAYITGVIQAPFGLSAELGVFPARKFKDFRMEEYAANIKWTVNEVFFDWLPVDVAVRAGFASGKLIYTQTVSSIPVNIDYSQMLWNANLLVSKQLLIFEPYLGAGFVHQNGTLTASAAGTFNLFGTELPFSAANSVTQKRVVPNLFIGLQTHIFFFNVTVHDDIQFGLNTFGFKLAFKF